MAWIKVSGGFPVTKSCEISQIEWIKCSDRLPNDAEDCYELVCYNENDDNPQSFLCSLSTTLISSTPSDFCTSSPVNTLTSGSDLSDVSTGSF